MLPRRISYRGVGLVLLTVAAYAPLARNDFVDFDDEKYVTMNPHVTEGLSWSGFKWAWTTCEGNYWMPISWLSLEVDGQLFRISQPDGQKVLSAAAFHIESLCWHLASVLLLFHLLAKMTAARWRSFFVAALFAVHPLRVESVAWAAERKDVLMMFFGLLTLLAYVRYQERPGTARYLLLVAAYLLSLLSKPMLMTLPFVLLLLDYWPLRRLAAGPGGGVGGGPVFSPPHTSPSLRRLLGEKAPLFLLAAAVGVITLVTRRLTGSLIPLSDIPFSIRLANAATGYGWYLGATLWPASLAAYYPHLHEGWSIRAALSGAGVLILTLLALWQGRRRPWLLVGWLWFVGTLLPVSGLAQGGPQAWADRFSYWPHIGLLVVLVWGLAEIVARLRIPARMVGTSMAAVLGCLVWLTAAQVRTWHDSFTLWERVAVVSPWAARAHANLGKMYQEKGRLDQARSHLAEAVRLEPHLSDYQQFLGTLLLNLGYLEEAVAHYQCALRLAPRYADSRVDSCYNLGVAYLRLGKPAEAARCFRQVLKRQPEATHALACLSLAELRRGQRDEALRLAQQAVQRDAGAADAWYALGTTYLAAGRLDEAVAALTEAVRLHPHLVNACRDLGTALYRKGYGQEALLHLSRAVELQREGERQLLRMKGRPPLVGSVPALVLLRCQLAFVLKRQGYEAQARQEYQAALDQDSSWPHKLTIRAWSLLTGRETGLCDPHQAYELASQAAEATDEPASRTLAVLTTAQAAVGRIPEAITTARRTLRRTLTTEVDGSVDVWTLSQP